MTPCGRHLGVETCRSWYHSVHTLDDIFIVRVGDSLRAGLSGIESRWGRDFPHLSRSAPWPIQAPIKWVPGFSPGVNLPGRGVDHPLPSSAEVVERVELYFYYSSVPSSPVLGRSLTLPLHIVRKYTAWFNKRELRQGNMLKLWKSAFVGVMWDFDLVVRHGTDNVNRFMF